MDRGVLLPDYPGMSRQPQNTDKRQNTDTRPWPGDYVSHREYLRDMTAFLKATERGFSFRAFSRRAGFSSPNFLKLVTDGQRNISAGSIARFGDGLRLTDAERDAFEALVLFTQADTDRERNRHFERLREYGSRSRAGHLHRNQYDMYAMWYAVVIRELASALPGSAVTRLADLLMPALSARHVEKAVRVLARRGLVRRDDAGLVTVVDRVVSTGSAAMSLAVRNFHRRMLEHAATALDRIPSTERNISALTMALTDKEYADVVLRLGVLRRQLLADFGASDDAEPRRIYHLILPIFPVTKEFK